MRADAGGVARPLADRSADRRALPYRSTPVTHMQPNPRRQAATTAQIRSLTDPRTEARSHPGVCSCRPLPSLARQPMDAGPYFRPWAGAPG